MGILGQYKNGNYSVVLLDDGTKMRYNVFGSLEPEYPESIDFKITNKCFGVDGVMCPYCHENSTPNGTHGDIMNMKFIDTLLPYTEIAIGGGDPLFHPDLVPFLEKLKEHKIIANITVNQSSFMYNIDFIKELVAKKLIYGLGVSLVSATDDFIDTIKQFPNAVIHVINGIVRQFKLEKLANNNLNILILGYKEFRRGKDLYDKLAYIIEDAQKELHNILPTMIEENWFNAISFDNLAIKQLDPRRFMSDKDWYKFFMGDDGEYTMYIDGVNEEFAVSSTSTGRHKLEDDIKTMFDIVREESNGDV